MEKMWALVKKFAKDEEGMETVEYAVVAGLVILVGVGIWTTLGGRISAVMQSLVDAMTT